MEVQHADVRREALRVLESRLRPGVSGGMEFWEGMSVDLSGAVLVDADFSGCRLTAGRFADTRFQGDASFEGARFGDALFWRALFEGDAGFAGVRFDGDAAFGRVRFHGDTDFEDARFGGMAWFGRGEEGLDEDDAVWETVGEPGWAPLPWDELNEKDPGWPIAVLVEDYQEWTEGGDGARFNGRASFRNARFDGAAWFWKARFGAGAAFGGARFNGPVHLDQPTVDLTGARAALPADNDPQDWPFGWRADIERTAEPEHDGSTPLVPDESVSPYARQLADSSCQVRLSGLQLMQALGDAAPELRQRIVDALCEYLRIPLDFDLADGTAARTADQAEELTVRRAAQRILTERLRPRPAAGGTQVPAPGSEFWGDLRLRLSGATLIDFDLTECQLTAGDFSGAQFYGVSSFERSSFGERASFCLGGGGEGTASFHGDANFAGARFTGEWHRGCCDLHANLAG